MVLEIVFLTVEVHWALGGGRTGELRIAPLNITFAAKTTTTPLEGRRALKLALRCLGPGAPLGDGGGRG